VHAQEGGRLGYIADAADAARDDAPRLASRAGGEERARLIAERDGACGAFLAATSTAAQPSPARS